MQKKMRKEWQEGDKVYFINSYARICKTTIRYIVEGEWGIQYASKNAIHFSANQLFSSPQELLEYLQSQIPKLK